MLLVYHLGGEARKDAEAEPCYSTDSKCKSWTATWDTSWTATWRKMLLQHPKRVPWRAQSRSGRWFFVFLFLLLPKFTLLFFFGRVTRLNYPFWLAHVCHHHQEGLNGSMSDQWSRKQATVANLSQPEGLVAAPEVKGEVQRFDEWSGAPCETKSHDVRCRTQHRTES